MAEPNLRVQNQVDLKLFTPDKQLTYSDKERNAELVKPRTYNAKIPPLSPSHITMAITHLPKFRTLFWS
jgi:hypothetical protein